MLVTIRILKGNDIVNYYWRQLIANISVALQSSADNKVEGFGGKETWVQIQFLVI